MGANFTVYRGDNNDLDLAVTKSGNPVNLTGATLRFTAKLDKADPDADAVIAKVSTDSSQIEITDAVNGLATVHILPADTFDLEDVSVLFYDAQVVDGTGAVYTLAEGKIKVILDVTRTV